MNDVFFIVCDGLKGLPDSANAVFPLATVQTCVIRLIRGTFRYASKRYWEPLARDLRPIYTAPTAEAAWVAFEAFEETWAGIYPAIGKLWRASWQEFIPFLAHDVEIRRVVCSTDEIVNAAACAGGDGVVPSMPATGAGDGGPQPRSRWSPRLEERP